MRNILILTTLTVIHLCTLVSFGDPVRVQAQEGEAPILLAPIPGTYVESAEGRRATLRTYLPGLFRLLIGLAALLAVIMIIIGGLQYMFSAGSGGKGAAREKISSAVIGLLLVLGAWLLLRTINPNLVNFNLEINSTSLSSSGPPSPTPGPTPPGPNPNPQPPTPTDFRPFCTSIANNLASTQIICGTPDNTCKVRLKSAGCKEGETPYPGGKPSCWQALGLCKKNPNDSNGGNPPPPSPPPSPPPNSNGGNQPPPSPPPSSNNNGNSNGGDPNVPPPPPPPPVSPGS